MEAYNLILALCTAMMYVLMAAMPFAVIIFVVTKMIRFTRRSINSIRN